MNKDNPILTTNVQGQLVDFSMPKVMGILNITPDSFFAGSRKQTEEEIVDRVHQLRNEGADFIDVGGYSSRPNAAFVDETEEMERLAFGLKILFREYPDAVVSVDTFRSVVARRCVEEFGVAIVNDISGGQLDPQLFDTVADLGVPYILMHMRGTPQAMMQDTSYRNLMPDILVYLSERVNLLHQKGVNDIWIDPGFGFSKTTDQNYKVLENLEEFLTFELPLLVGFSRKTMIREVIGTAAADSLNGTTALNMLALTKGANILRVHDVKEAVETVKLYNKTRYFE
ncbi:dihydropteroate synthase [Bacteroidales bacterium OttesenSCG-928-J19]|nr:dihydropteroate synthase [Bacteroidales bacterium OttesenSCG-928-J19]